MIASCLCRFRFAYRLILFAFYLDFMPFPVGFFVPFLFGFFMPFSTGSYKIRVEREKAYNRKMDAAKKVVADLMERYDTVYFQDEMIASWHASPSYSGRVQHSFVGAVKSLLMGIFSGTDGRRAFCIQRGFPTTKLCCTSGEINSIGRFQKEFHCTYCESEEGDRDAHAAETIRKLGSAIRAQWLDEPCVEGDSSILSGVLEHYRRGQDRLMKRRLSETAAS